MTLQATEKGGDALLRLKGVGKKFGGNQVVSDVSLALAKGQLLTLLGPSGCGKSTLLRMIAGFEQPTQGTIAIEDRDVTRWQPEKRPTAMVFQSYALFPHLTVFENVAFGLRLRKRSSSDIARLVRDALALVRMEGFADRYPSELSGGQQQRVALARGLVIEPKILLLDEPLGALDRSLREQMQVELRKLQKQLEITMLVVTHDQEEAFVLSDYVAVMNAGRIVQYARPTELYDRPASEFVARFMGIPNLLSGSVTRRSEGMWFSLRADAQMGFQVPLSEEERPEAVVALRPETLRLCDPGDAAGQLRGRVSFTTLIGSRINCEVSVGAEVVHVSVPRGAANPCVGDLAGIAVDSSHATVLRS